MWANDLLEVYKELIYVQVSTTACYLVEGRLTELSIIGNIVHDDGKKSMLIGACPRIQRERHFVTLQLLAGVVNKRYGQLRGVHTLTIC